ncbi:MAG: hypothetical protein ABI237_08900 [Ginsengibacter sp.]
MEEKKLSEKESLELIANMIGKAKNHYSESGASALLWGITNVVCFILAYLQETVRGFNLPFSPFYLMIVTAILQVYFYRRERGINKTISYKDEAHYFIWLAFGISLLILTVAGGFADIGYIVLPLILLLFAIPTFISGCIKKFKPLIIGGIICWLLSIISFFYRENEVFLLVALGAFFAWVVPGIILRKRFYKNIANQHNGV